jgi:hypothetical protein
MKPLILSLLLLIFAPLTQVHAKGLSCSSRLGRIPDGGTAYGYGSAIGTEDTPCFMMAVSCRGGLLSGPDLYPNCRNLDLRGSECYDGDTITAFASSTPPCYLKTIVCVRGRWNGTVSAICR